MDDESEDKRLIHIGNNVKQKRKPSEKQLKALQIGRSKLMARNLDMQLEKSRAKEERAMIRNKGKPKAKPKAKKSAVVVNDDVSDPTQEERVFDDSQGAVKKLEPLVEHAPPGFNSDQRFMQEIDSLRSQIQLVTNGMEELKRSSKPSSFYW
jgi:hypothetical protein